MKAVTEHLLVRRTLIVLAVVMVCTAAAYAEEKAECTPCCAKEDCAAPCEVEKAPAACLGCQQKCPGITITVSNDTPVWWGNRGKAYGNYMKFAKARIRMPEPLPTFAPIYFDLDKAVLRPDGIETAEKVLAFMRSHPYAKARIEGNCCDLATNAYNMRLGERRAEAVKRYLVEHGIDAERLCTLTNGEEKRVTTAPDERPVNRRADVIMHRGHAKKKQ